MVVIHLRHSRDQDAMKITVARGNVNGDANDAFRPRRNGPIPGDIHLVEAGSMVISI